MWRSHSTVLLDSCRNRGPRRQVRTSARRRRGSRLGFRPSLVRSRTWAPRRVQL